MIKRIIAIIVAMLLVNVAAWSLVGASAWAEMTPLPQKFYECASVVLFWSALITLVASGNNEKSTEEI